nr:tail tip protein [Pseudomonas aeruginosa]
MSDTLSQGLTTIRLYGGSVQALRPHARPIVGKRHGTRGDECLEAHHGGIRDVHARGGIERADLRRVPWAYQPVRRATGHARTRGYPHRAVGDREQAGGAFPDDSGGCLDCRGWIHDVLLRWNQFVPGNRWSQHVGGRRHADAQSPTQGPEGPRGPRERPQLCLRRPGQHHRPGPSGRRALRQAPHRRRGDQRRHLCRGPAVAGNAVTGPPCAGVFLPEGTS